MRIDIPDDIAKRAEVNVSDLLIAMAITLYVDNKLDHADATSLCKLNTSKFNDELLARGIVVQQYPVTDRDVQKQSA